MSLRFVTYTDFFRLEAEHAKLQQRYDALWAAVEGKEQKLWTDLVTLADGRAAAWQQEVDRLEKLMAMRVKEREIETHPLGASVDLATTQVRR